MSHARRDGEESKHSAQLKELHKSAKDIHSARVRSVHGHTKKVHTLEWNCDGSLLASGGMDATARLWSVDSSGHAKSAAVLKGHSDSVDQLCWHPTNKSALATASADRTVAIWDARTHKLASSIKTPGENINIEWSPSGNLLAVGNKDEVVSLVDVRKGRVVKKMQFSRCEVNELAWHPTGGFLYLTKGHKYGSVDEGCVQIMKLRGTSLETHAEFPVHTSTAYCIQFDKTGKLFATGGADGLVCVFDAQENVCLRSFDRLELGVRSIAFSHDSRYIASGSEDSFVAISDVNSGLRVRAIECGVPTNAVAWHPSRYVLAFANDVDSPTMSSSSSSSSSFLRLMAVSSSSSR